MRTTWPEDCDRAVARVQCGQRGEPACLQLGCPRCAAEQILKTQFEYEVIAVQLGETAALKSAVQALGETRAHVSRTDGLANALLDAYRYLLQEEATGESTVRQYRTVLDRAARALRNAGVLAVVKLLPADEVLCVYCGGSDHTTESPAGERCREEQERERRSIAFGGSVTPGDLEEMDAEAEAEREADRQASRADRIADEARDEAALG